MMPEGTTGTEGEKGTTIVPDKKITTLPGGFESAEKMYEALEKAKADLAENKTRKTDNTALQTELDVLKEADTKRLEGERTDLENAQAKIVTLEAAALASVAAVSKANRDTLFERVLSDRLAGMGQDARKLVRMHYTAAVSNSGGFEDEDALKAILDPVDELLKGMTDADGTTVIMLGGTPQEKEKSKSAPGFFKSFADMSPLERIKHAREHKKG